MIHFDIPDLHKVVDEMVDETYRTFKQAESEVKEIARIAVETLVVETPQWTGNLASNWRVRTAGQVGVYEEVSQKVRFGFDAFGNPGPGLIEARTKTNADRGFPRSKGNMRSYVGATMDDTLADIGAVKFNPDAPGRQSIVIYNKAPYAAQVEEDNATDLQSHSGKYIRKVNYHTSSGPITIALAVQKAVAKAGGKWRV